MIHIVDVLVTVWLLISIVIVFCGHCYCPNGQHWGLWWVISMDEASTPAINQCNGASF